MKIKNQPLWITIAVILIYLFLADLYFENVINKEMRYELQLVFSFVFILITFYVIRLIVKNVMDQIKLKKDKE